MRIDRRLAINLITVLLLGVVTVGWVVTRLVGTSVGGGPFTVTVDLADSGGVFTNQEVTYRGVLVGRVGEMSLNEDGVDVKLLIDREWMDEIPADVVASVQSKSAVGEQFVNLTPRSDSDDKLTDGDVIARSDTELPVEFQALLRSLDRVLAEVSPDATRRVVEELAGGLGGRSEEIATILRSLGTLSNAFASVAPEQRRLLQNAPRAGAAFLATKDEFAAAIRAADAVAAGIGDEPEELSALFRANDRFAREGILLLARHGDQLAGGIEALADLMTFQVSNKDAIIDSFEHLPGFLHAVEDASIPWRSPDGREFFRIRTGLIFEPVPASWPCGYKVPEDYTRLPHVREKKRVLTGLRCDPDQSDAAEVAVALQAALSAWADTQPQQAEPAPTDPVWDAPVLELLDATDI